MAYTARFKIIPAIVIMLSLSAPLFAADVNDGFEVGRQTKSRYFNIFIQPGTDIDQLTLYLSVPPGIRAMISASVSDFDTFNLPNQLDLLYLAVSETLDVRLKKFECNIKICKDSPSLTAITERLYGTAVEKAGGFYVPEADTIYLDAQSVSINVLAHELSHAIQSKYFVIPPPTKVQEVLAGFVEFQFRKQTGTLPKGK